MEFKDKSGKVIRCAKGGYAITLYIVGRPYDPQNVLQYYDARISTLPFEQITVGGKDGHIGANAALGFEGWLVQAPLGNKTLLISFCGDGYILSSKPVASQEGLRKVRQILSTFEL